MKTLLSCILISSMFLFGCNVVNTDVVQTEEETESQVELTESTLVIDLEEIESRWGSAMLRGDAELAPTYSEFLDTIRSISEDLDEVLDQYDTNDELEELSGDLHASLMRGDAELAPTYEEAMAESYELLEGFKAILETLEQ